MKRLVTGFVYYVQYSFSDKPHLCWWDKDDMGKTDPAWTLVGPHNFEIECPDDFDPRPGKIAALEEKRRKLRADFAKDLTKVEDEISKLLSLEMAEA